MSTAFTNEGIGPDGNGRATPALNIDKLLEQAGWSVQDSAANLHAARGVASREFELKPGHGTADYLLYVDGKAAGVIEAKKEGATLTGVEVQSGKYAQGLPAALPAHRLPLPFLYQQMMAEANCQEISARAINGDLAATVWTGEEAVA